MKKINIAELLKDCPKGMELDCSMYENVEFDYIEQNPEARYPIHCLMKTNDGYNTMVFTNNGCNDRHPNAKCVIFPKGKTTWEGFQRPFKDGDVLVGKSNQPFIFKKLNNSDGCFSYCGIDRVHNFHLASSDWTFADSLRFATEEEKQKLFQAIKDNGYEWDPQTKTLKKLIVSKFKVGDKITNGKVSITIGYIDDNYYYEVGRNIANRLFIKNQDDWKLVPNKFDITTLKPFESKVLVRSSMDGLWKPAVFGFRNGYNDNAFYIVGGSCWKQCIPYLNNEHLCGTTNDCDDYFKTWE